MEYNKYRFQKTNDKKVLHKVKKHWVVMSMALLMAIGGEAVATHVSAHADTSNNDQNNDSINTVKDRLNQQLVQGQKQAQNNQSQGAQNNSKQASQINTNMISKQASVLHQRIVNNATAATNSHANLGVASQGRVNGSVNSTDNSAVNNRASQNQTTPASSASAKGNTVPSSAPINKTVKPNSAYANYLKQNPKLASAYADDITTRSSIMNNKHKRMLGGDYYAPFKVGATGTYRGLNYRLNSGGNVEITGGTAQSDLSNFFQVPVDGNSGIPTTSDYGTSVVTSITFDNDIDTSHVTNMSSMFAGLPVTSINLGSNFDTSNVKNMNSMFAGDSSLQTIQGLSDFDTSNVTDMGEMFGMDSKLTNLDLSHFDTRKVTNMMGMLDQGVNPSSEKINHTLQSIKLSPDCKLSSNVLNQQNSDGIIEMTGTPRQRNDLASFLKNCFDKYTHYNYDDKNKYNDIYEDLGDIASNFQSNIGFTNLSPQAFINHLLKGSDIKFDYEDAYEIVYVVNDLNQGIQQIIQQLMYSAQSNEEPMDERSVDKQYADQLKSNKALLDLYTHFVNSEYATVRSPLGINNNNQVANLFDGKSHPGTWSLTLYNKNANNNIDFVTPSGKLMGSDNIGGHHFVGDNASVGTDSYTDIPVPNDTHLADGKPSDKIVLGLEPATVTVNSNKVPYSDIYRKIDNMTNPASDVWTGSGYQTPINEAPVNWAFVKADGHISNTPIKNGAGKIMVAPVYKGMTYKYDQAKNTVEFTGGTANQYANEVNSKIDNVSDAVFDNGVDLSQVNSMNDIFANDSKLRDLVISSDVKLGSGTTLPSGAWVDMSANSPQSVTSGSVAHPGIWTRNAVMVDYILNGQQNINEGHEIFLGPLNSKIMIGKNPLGLNNGYQVSQPGNVTVNGGVAYVSVEDNTIKHVNTSINVKYLNNHGNTISDNIPVTLTGNDNNMVYFSPADVAAPNGYQLDKSQTQSDYAYDIDASNNGNGHWDDNVTPTIVFQGNQENKDSVTVNQIIESPKGAIVRQKAVNVPVDGNVGNTYTISDTDPSIAAPSGTKLAASTDPNGSRNQSVTGEILPADANTTYLSQPSVTFYYVDSGNDAKGTLKIHYINQRNDQVGSFVTDNNEYANSDKAYDVSASSLPGLPEGYTLSNPNAKYMVHLGTQDVNVAVTGVPETVKINYYYNGQQVLGSSSDQVTGMHVGDTIDKLPTSKLPQGYQLTPGDQTSYKINYNDSNSGIIDYHMNVEPISRVFPFQFVDQNNNPVGGVNYSLNGRLGQQVQLPDAPKGYTYVDATQQNHTITQSDLMTPNNDNQFNTFTIKLNGNPETLPVNFINIDGTKVGTSDVSGEIGNTVSIDDSVNAPAGYQLNPNHIKNYTFNADQINSNESGQMKPVNIYVRSADQRYQLNINAEEVPNPGSKPSDAIISQPKEITGYDGQVVTLYPNDYIPTGYSNDPSNKQLQVEITNHGLINAADASKNNPSTIQSYTWKYDTTNINGALYFQYYDTTSKQLLGSPISINGNYNSDVSLTTNHQPPTGYALDNDVQTNYVINNNLPVSSPQSPIKLDVHPIRGSKIPYFPLKIVIKTPTGSVMSKGIEGIPINVVQHGTQTITSNDIPAKDFPNGDKSHYNFDEGDSTGKGNITVTNNPSGLSPDAGTFIYYVNNKGIKPINVTYKNQNNVTVNKKTIQSPNDYYDEPVNVTDPSDGGIAVPNGYTLNKNQKINYTINDNVQNVTLYIEGNPVITTAPVQLMHTSKQYPNQNNYLSNVPEIVNLPIQGRVGDPLSFNVNDFAGYIPTGYHLAEYSDSTVGNTFNHGNFVKHQFNGQLTPSDSNGWHSDSWIHSDKPSDGDYWYQTDQGKLPLLVLQASDQKSINFNIFDTHNQIIDTITIGPGYAKDDRGTIANLANYDPSYNDPINTSVESPYVGLLPRGYHYDTSYDNPANPTMVRFGDQAGDVGIHVAGKLENIHIVYDDKNGNKIGSDYTSNQYLTPNGTEDNVRVGDVVNIPRFNVPKGYQVDPGQPTQYVVNYADDPASRSKVDTSEIGTITRTLTVTPDTESLPIKFVDQNNNPISSDVISDQIGKTIPLANNVKSMIPNGYTLDDDSNTAYQNYQFSTDNIDPKDQNFMTPVTLHVTGKPATIQINFVDGNGHTVHSQDVNSSVGDVITMPSSSVDAQQNYGLSNDYDVASSAYNVVVQPSDAGKQTPTATKVAVVGKLHDANNLKVNVVYEHGDGTTTSDNNLPVTVTGRYGSMAYFDPADLALPSGYQIDKGKGKTQTSYNVTMDQNDSDAAWDGVKNNPTIYLQGVGASHDLLINQVVESPAGAILGNTVSTVQVPVNGKVGDTYTVQANDPKITVPSGTTLATSTEPNGTLNKPLTGKILENEINGTKTVYLSQPADTLYYVKSNATSSVTVQYVNQAGNVVGSKSMPKEAIGTAVNMNQVNGNNVPAGYTYDNSNPTSDYYGPSDSTLYLKVDGNPASVNEEYYDGNSDMHVSAGTPTGSVGDTVTLATSNVPEGYHLVGNVQDYTFTPNDVSANTRHTEKIQLAPNQMTVPVNFVDQNGNQVGQTTVQDARDKKQSDTIGNVPVGYKLNNNSSDQYNFSKNTPNSSDTMPSDNVKVHAYDGTKINLHFQMPGYNYDVESDLVSGQFGTKLDAMNYMPLGFHLADPSQNTKLVYTFNGDSASAKDNNPVIEVEPDEANVKSINVNLVYQTPDGTRLSSDHVNVPIKTDAQGDFDITPNDTSLGSHITGYTPVKQSDIKGNLIGKLNVTDNTKQTFVYKANPETMQIQFMNQDGNNVGNPETANGYYSETVNANKLSDFGAKTPTGYTLMNPNATYQFANGQTSHVVMVNGNTANDNAKITIVENDPYGNKLNSFTTNEPISGQVGDDYDISADQLTPGGYQAVPAGKNDPQDLSGQIDADGKLSNGSATFVYNSTAATTGLKPIYLIYVANDQTVGSSKIEPPADPKKTDLYSDKTVDIKNEIYAGVPANYSVADGTQTTSSFSAQYPTVLYINVNRAGNKPLTYTANVVQNFYDPYGKLINVKSIPVTESGSLDQIYHISPKDYQVTGYTLKNDNSDTGIITANGLTPSTVVYDYSADSSSTKGSAVKPINVTFEDVDGNQPVGTPQRLDGTMDETVNVFDRTTIPSDYHLVANQNPFATFGTKAQNLTFKVAVNQKKIGKVTIMYYNANNHQLVDQVTAEDPVGTDFALEPYIHNVPQNYQFKSMDSNPLIDQADGQNPTIPVINGTRYVNMQVNKIVTNSIVYEDINNDQDPNVRPVSVQQVSGIEGTPIDHAKMLSAVPRGYHVAKLGSADPVLNGGKDVVWIQKDAPANSRIDVNYVKYAANGKRLGSDQTAVYGHVGDSFNLADYEQRVPSGYVFANASSTGSMDYFTGTDHTVTINVQQPTHHSNYGKIIVQFVKASDPSQQVGSQLISTGYNGDVFDVTPYEHNAPENYNYAGIVGKIPERYNANDVQELVIKVR